MRYLAVFLMCMSLFAVTVSRDIHRRYADSDDGALLEAFIRAVEEGKTYINSLVQDKNRDLKKRWWWGSDHVSPPTPYE
ncbi:hypothetical protein ACJMK2_033467 [Sinanodonta woodiana]|uniref:Uncharacterized protein n=1 Tax=Sinanodonta woodiana TaxID=1069815 RepID=A0ABD3WNG7_SINWO